LIADDAITTDQPPVKIGLEPGSGLEGAFYYKSRPATAPNWLSFVRPILSSDPNVTSSSSSAVLVLKAGAEFFALTFGFGRSLLDQTKIERQFGLKVALNRVNPDQIRSIDAKTFEDMVVSKNIQTSRSTDFPSFGVDVTRDIVRAVVGEPSDKNFAKRVSGSDALVVNLNILPKDLPAKLLEFLAAYEDTAYKANFDWIDHLSIVLDKDVQEALDVELIKELNSGSFGSTHLAMPEPLDWQDIDSFKITGTRAAEYDELDLEEYFKGLPRPVLFTMDALKTRKVSVKFGRNSDYESRWSLYDCLVSEQSHKGELFVLIEGRWFAVSKSLIKQVDDFAKQLTPAVTTLPPAVAGEHEDVYNARVADADPQLVNLDKKILRAAGASSGIEAADLMSTSGEFIHVKRKSRSSTLSHLFAQGSVSATTLVGDLTFRANLRKAIEDAAKPRDPAPWLDLVPSTAAIDRGRMSVSYVVIADSAKAGVEWLPFFSRLNLMQHGKQLLNLGVHVSLERVNAS